MLAPAVKRTTVVFVPIAADTGLDKVHPTWAGTYILDACVFLFPAIHFALIDSDCVPVTLSKFRNCGYRVQVTSTLLNAAHNLNRCQAANCTSAQEARSVDTGRATQQPGPPVKLPKSRSVEDLAATHMRAPSPDAVGSFEDEVDFGGSERRVPSRLNATN